MSQVVETGGQEFDWRGPVGSGPGVIVAVPGLNGGVDEASRHLFGDRAMTDRWSVSTLVTRGGRPLAAPLVLAAALARLIVQRVRGRVDLVHLNVSSRGSAYRKMMVAATARGLGLPYVIQLHGGGFERFHGELHPMVRRAVDRFFGGAAHVLVLGRPFQTLVEDRVGIPDDRVSILRNAVAVPARSGRPGRTAGPPMILFTGRLGPSKGTPELLDALAGVAELPWTAVLVGDGEVAETSERVRAIGLGDRVEVRGWQSRRVVSELLDAASVFVLPSHLEALSVSLLEAMAAGLCCIATPVGAQGEIVEHDLNGLLIEPGDTEGLTAQLARALSDHRLRGRLGAEAQATVRATCSTVVVAERLSAVYADVLSRS